MTKLTETGWYRLPESAPAPASASVMFPIPAGALFTITMGEYSSYQIEGVFRATQELDTSGLVEAYLVEHPDQRERFHFREAEFMGWLAQKGLLEPIETWEWHLGEGVDMYVHMIC